MAGLGEAGLILPIKASMVLICQCLRMQVPWLRSTRPSRCATQINKQNAAGNTSTWHQGMF